jgi:hypothetical protein
MHLLLLHNHSFGTIDNNMQILQHQKKGPQLNTLERFHIRKEATINNPLNDDHTMQPTQIFNTILKYTPFQPTPTTHPHNRVPP